MITYNNMIVTYIKKITNIANEYLISKVNIIRSKFSTDNTVKPMTILKSLLSRVEESLVIPIPSINDITEIISKSKATQAVGNDIITMAVIKKLSPKVVPHITHLITRILITETYPDILKVTRIYCQI